MYNRGHLQGGAFVRSDGGVWRWDCQRWKRLGTVAECERKDLPFENGKKKGQ